MLLGRQENIFKVALFYLPDQSIVTKITKDAKMSVSDKISWVGGMMGLFTGFSVISGIEILYWLWFKVLLHKSDGQVAPAPEEAEEKENAENGVVDEVGKDEKLIEMQMKMEGLQSEVDELKMRLKNGHGDDPKAGMFFDAIFNDVEAQQKTDTDSNSV